MVVDFRFLDALIAPEFTKVEDFMDDHVIDLMVEKFGNQFQSNHKPIWKNVWKHNIFALKQEIGNKPPAYFRVAIEADFMKMIRSMIILNPIHAKYIKKARWRYAGPDDHKCRPFCAKRVHNAYTEKEIYNWNYQDWDGKMTSAYGFTDDDIFTNLGGWGCRHYLLPENAGEEDVPNPSND